LVFCGRNRCYCIRVAEEKVAVAKKIAVAEKNGSGRRELRRRRISKKRRGEGFLWFQKTDLRWQSLQNFLAEIEKTWSR
jgi:hypothetical protein